MRHRPGSSAVLLAVLIAGCKPDAGSTGQRVAPAASVSSGTTKAAAVDAFCQQAFGAIAEQVLGGCSDEERAAPSSRNVIEFAREPLKECRRLSAGVAADRLTFDGAAAAQCLASTSAAKRVDGTWGDLTVPDLDESPACDGVFTGNQGEGQACSSTLECREPLTCLGASDDKGKGGDGTCKPIPTRAGEPCDPVFLRVTDFKHRLRCADGKACDPVEDTCKAARGTGAECTHSFECARPLACRAGRCSSEPPAGVGGPCEDDTDDCKPGLFCSKPKGAASTSKGAGDAGKVTAQGKCAEKKPAGSSCTQELFECKGECKKPSEHEEGTCVSRCGSG